MMNKNNLLTNKAGYWSALIVTIAGIGYFLLLAGMSLSGGFTFPPAEDIQLIAGVYSLVVCPVFIVVMACLHMTTPPEKQIFSLCSLAFTILFVISVSINRFTQLGVVRLGSAAGLTGGIEWFLPYGDYSVMLGLEMMGWGWFLGLAMLAAAPLFSGGKLASWLRWLMVSYGVMGLICAVAFLVASPLVLIGFFAWGVVLVVITALLTIHFRRSGR
jgi:hypothetical protein